MAENYEIYELLADLQLSETVEWLFFPYTGS